jgi:proteasome lid subunit RPN8/RPN11
MTGFTTPTLRLRERDWRAIVGHCYDGLPNEACGVFAGHLRGDGTPDGKVDAVYLTDNSDQSALTYTVDSKGMLRALRDAEGRGLELFGVFHSHTHTDAFPSPTDVAKAPDPTWIYAIVSLKHDAPVLRAYRIVDGTVAEVAVELDR